MTIDRDLLLVAEAQRYMEGLGIARIALTLDLEIMVGVIGFVQLGLRHPEANRTAAAFHVRTLLDQVIHDLDPARGPLFQLLMRGFDKDFDVMRPIDPIPKSRFCGGCGLMLAGPPGYGCESCGWRPS